MGPQGMMSENRVTTQKQPPAVAAQRTLLIVDDDEPFRSRLAQAMRTRGYKVDTAAGVAEALAKVKASAPEFAVVDLRLIDGYGLDVVPRLRECQSRFLEAHLAVWQ